MWLVNTVKLYMGLPVWYATVYRAVVVTVDNCFNGQIIYELYESVLRTVILIRGNITEGFRCNFLRVSFRKNIHRKFVHRRVFL